MARLRLLLVPALLFAVPACGAASALRGVSSAARGCGAATKAVGSAARAGKAARAVRVGAASGAVPGRAAGVADEPLQMLKALPPKAPKAGAAAASAQPNKGAGDALRQAADGVGAAGDVIRED